MAKKNRDNSVADERDTSSEYVQNDPPARQWNSLEQFWNACVKNGTPLLFVSFRAHLKAMGWLDDQSKWTAGAKHFGIPLEK